MKIEFFLLLSAGLSQLSVGSAFYDEFSRRSLEKDGYRKPQQVAGAEDKQLKRAMEDFYGDFNIGIFKPTNAPQSSQSPFMAGSNSSNFIPNPTANPSSTISQPPSSHPVNLTHSKTEPFHPASPGQIENTSKAIFVPNSQVGSKKASQKGGTNTQLPDPSAKPEKSNPQQKIQPILK